MTDEERKQFINEYCRNVAHKPMTKLCDTCEYLRYCARSGIEEVGCDRYKRDTTTNKEWMQTATTEQLAKWLAHHSRFIYECGEKQVAPKTMHEEDWERWLKQPHHAKE